MVPASERASPLVTDSLSTVLALRLLDGDRRLRLRESLLSFLSEVYYLFPES
jgi:hypothetical protein